MKVKFVCNSGANIHSARQETFDTEDLGFTEEEWNELSDDSKFEVVQDWAKERLEIYWKDIQERNLFTLKGFQRKLKLCLNIRYN